MAVKSGCASRLMSLGTTVVLLAGLGLAVRRSGHRLSGRPPRAWGAWPEVGTSERG